MGWKNLSHMDFHIAEAHPRDELCREKPRVWRVCSRTYLGVQHLEVIFTSGSHLDAEGGLDLSKAGGALNWISAVPGGFCQWFLSRNHILPASVFPSTLFLCRICAWHWFWALLCAAKQLLCPTSKWASLHSWKKTTLNQKRVFYSPSVKHCSPYLSLQGSLREFSPKIHLNMYCSFSSPVPAAARIHTHSHHIFCLSVGTVVLPAWVLLQSHGEEGGKLPCFLSDGVW